MVASKVLEAEALRTACESIEQNRSANSKESGWQQRLADFIQWFGAASAEELASEAFQHRLWDDNPVSAIGQGNIDIRTVLAESEVREWLARELGRDFGDDVAARRKHIVTLAKKLREKFLARLPKNPQLKTFRVLAVAYPEDISTVADGRRVRALYREIFGGRAKQPILAHFEIMDRLAEVLGPAGADPMSLAGRMILPWTLYEKYALNADEDATEEVVDAEGGTKLLPMAAARRRRGLTVIANGLQTILGALDFIEDGVARDELIAHLRTLLPNYKDSSLNVAIGLLTSELGLIRRDNDLLVLTDRGQALLDTEDPSELSDWLLTRVLGLDMALVILRDEGNQSKTELMARIRVCNPGWTTNFMPSALLSWLRSFGVIEDADGKTKLTEVGQQWAQQIHWKPAILKPEPEIESLVTKDVAPELTTGKIELPSLDEIIRSVQDWGHFDARLIRNLHAGLWSNPQRHFAVLSGLSGTGKTLLARSYGDALSPDGLGVYQLPVQPGWYDAGSVLGYVNPLRPDAYARTRFLEFLMHAVDYPHRPHVAILDEMNLSHPEQYFAPLLSAMESRNAEIELHQEGEDFDGIPQRLPYPQNLVLIGTVNMDETTHGLSDKVLDRAFTMEFWDVDIAAYPEWHDFGLPSPLIKQTQVVLTELYDALRGARLHFGWRTIADVLGFLRASSASGNSEEMADLLDSIVYAKVLPKLRGDDSQRFRVALDEARATLELHGLKRSAQRVSELKEDLDSIGMARFWR